ncbi:hypothetical protein CAL27_18090 [Bordetella genomosp. 1]|uniref:Uncharacterized protein n=1 Tax=Bordetella genomosp. 1 TaxID=1395607 RepID=A0ABX4EVV3_9BORD|nr:hypothetical protein CAL27_18090 [Bordetella genomosp. 1]
MGPAPPDLPCSVFISHRRPGASRAGGPSLGFNRARTVQPRVAALAIRPVAPGRRARKRIHGF